MPSSRPVPRRSVYGLIPIQCRRGRGDADDLLGANALQGDLAHRGKRDGNPVTSQSRKAGAQEHRVRRAARFFAQLRWNAGSRILPTLKLWKARVKVCDYGIDWLAVDEAAGWLDVTPDAARRLLMPTDIERTKFGKEVKVTVR